jgi:hypothetical protein
MRFSEYLKEAKQQRPEWFLDTKQDIELLFRLHEGKNPGFKVLDNLQVSCRLSEPIELTTDHMIRENGKLYLPCQFNSCGKYTSIDVPNDKIGSLLGLADFALSLYISAQEINFDYFPEEIATGVSFYNVKSLQGIGKNKCLIRDHAFLRGDDVKSHALGTILFEYGEKALIHIANNDKLGSILTRHARDRDKDILECQEELIEAGYKEFAKL